MRAPLCVHILQLQAAPRWAQARQPCVPRLGVVAAILQGMSFRGIDQHMLVAAAVADQAAFRLSGAPTNAPIQLCAVPLQRPHPELLPWLRARGMPLLLCMGSAGDQAVACHTLEVTGMCCGGQHLRHHAGSIGGANWCRACTYACSGVLDATPWLQHWVSTGRHWTSASWASKALSWTVRE